MSSSQPATLPDLWMLPWTEDGHLIGTFVLLCMTPRLEPRGIVLFVTGAGSEVILYPEFFIVSIVQGDQSPHLQVCSLRVVCVFLGLTFLLPGSRDPRSSCTTSPVVSRTTCRTVDRTVPVNALTGNG